MVNRKQHVTELMDAAQVLRRKASGLSRHTGNRITPSQWLVIGYISQHEGASTNETAAALRMSGSAVTQLVNGLVTQGFLKRQPDPRDRRANTLVVSSKSKKRISGFKKKHVQTMLKMFEALSDKEFEQYVALSKKILTSFSAEII